VSVIVPIYGVERYLERCVDSVLGQSYRKLEIILVDDGSPDRCGEMCDDYASRDDRIRVIHQANAGVSAARNVGIDAAQGELLMFVDADDWLEPNIVDHLVTALHHHGANIAACHFTRQSQEGQRGAPVNEASRTVMTSRRALELFAGPQASLMTAPWAKVYRRSLFDGIRFPVGRLYEDEFVTYRVVGRADRVVLSSAELYHYFVRAESTTQRSQDADQVQDRVAALRERREYFRTLGLDHAAAISAWKAFLLSRLASRLAHQAGDDRSVVSITHQTQALARDVLRSDLPLRHRAFAGAYALAPRPVDAGLAAARRVVASARTRQVRKSVPGAHAAGAGSVAPIPLDHPGDRPLEVVVVAYKNPELLREALAPVVSLPVTVVDNSSMDEIAELCQALGVRYFDAGRNGGFAAGVNIGLANRMFRDSDVLLLNPDAVISEADVRRLRQVLLSKPDLASVGPAQVDADGRPSRVTWPFPSPWGTWAEALGLHRLRRRARTYVIGSVLLLRAEAIDDVGRFDERFFLYSEEADWAYRACRRGWRHEVVRDVVALHVGGATSSDETRRSAHFHGSQERYLRKHYGAVGWHATRWGQVFGDSLRGHLGRGSTQRRLKQRAALYRRGPAAAEAAHVARSASPANDVDAISNGGGS